MHEIVCVPICLQVSVSAVGSLTRGIGCLYTLFKNEPNSTRYMSMDWTDFDSRSLLPVATQSKVQEDKVSMIL